MPLPFPANTPHRIQPEQVSQPDGALSSIFDQSVRRWKGCK